MRCAQFDIFLSRRRCCLGRMNNKHVCSNEKWKESESLRHCSISMQETIKKSLLLIAGGRERETDWRTKGNLLLLKAEKHRLAFISLLFPQYPGNCLLHACSVGGVVSMKCHHSLACRKFGFSFRGLRFNDRLCIDRETKTKVSMFMCFGCGFVSSKVLRIANASRRRCFQVIFHFAESFRFHSSEMSIISPDVY